MKISGWGKQKLINCKIVKPKTISEIKRSITKNCISRGMGRSYGDSSIQPKKTIVMTNFSKIINFDNTNGIIKVQAGIKLLDLLGYIVPKGWFIPVSPGTKFVTIGGMIASNVHGKNHHKVGGLVNFLKEIKVIDENKKIRICSNKIQKNFFLSTCGGMGLTGVVIEATIKLKKIDNSYIKETIYCTKELKETINQITKSNKHEYSIAWLDCTSNKNFGRGVIFCGEHARRSNLIDKNRRLFFVKKSNFKIFFPLPKFIFNRFFIKVFNNLYYHINLLKKKTKIVNYDSFFYPLDRILNWNNLYGKYGFIQYQCVVPQKKNLLSILSILKYSNIESFLVTIKILKKDKGLLSFPIEGYTIAIDIPSKKNNITLLNKLNDQVIKSKGKVYLTKDSFMTEYIFKKMYNKNLEKFKKIIRKKKNIQIFNSLQSKRLNL